MAGWQSEDPGTAVEQSSDGRQMAVQQLSGGHPMASQRPLEDDFTAIWILAGWPLDSRLQAVGISQRILVKSINNEIVDKGL